MIPSSVGYTVAHHIIKSLTKKHLFFATNLNITLLQDAKPCPWNKKTGLYGRKKRPGRGGFETGEMILKRFDILACCLFWSVALHSECA